MADLGARLDAIVEKYTRRGEHPDHGRRHIHELGPEAKATVLAHALTAQGSAKRMLVLALCDDVYPPAMPQFRAWLDDDDEEVRLYAACALDAAYGKRFKVVDRIGGPGGLLTRAMDAVKEEWDRAPASVPTEAEWLTEQLDKRRRDLASVPPPEPGLTDAERASLRADAVQLKSAFDKLPAAVRHRLDWIAVGRALPLYAAVFPDDPTLHEAHQPVAQFLADGQTSMFEAQDRVTEAIRRAKAVAGWSPAHQRWHRPDAKAAADVAQALWYVLRSRSKNTCLVSLYLLSPGGFSAGHGPLGPLPHIRRHLETESTSDPSASIFRMASQHLDAQSLHGHDLAAGRDRAGRWRLRGGSGRARSAARRRRRGERGGLIFAAMSSPGEAL